jgi:hypothetical protein
MASPYNSSVIEPSLIQQASNIFIFNGLLQTCIMSHYSTVQLLTREQSNITSHTCNSSIPGVVMVLPTSGEALVLKQL